MGGAVTYFGPDGRPIGLGEWSARFEDIDSRRVDATIIGDVRVSTVWLGLDHGDGGDGPPLIFETMIFPECEYCVRRTTYNSGWMLGRIAMLRSLGEALYRGMPLDDWANAEHERDYGGPRR